MPMASELRLKKRLFSSVSGTNPLRYTYIPTSIYGKTPTGSFGGLVWSSHHRLARKAVVWTFRALCVKLTTGHDTSVQHIHCGCVSFCWRKSSIPLSFCDRDRLITQITVQAACHGTDEWATTMFETKPWTPTNPTIFWGKNEVDMCVSVVWHM